MKLARNLILAGIAWRLIARRRAALARERRARRIAPLLVTAGGAGLPARASWKVLAVSWTLPGPRSMTRPGWASARRRGTIRTR